MVRATVTAGVLALAVALGAVSLVDGVPGDVARAGPVPAAVETPAATAGAASDPATPAGSAAPAPAPAPAPAGSVAPSSTYVAPLDPPLVVARPFDAPPQPWAAGHRGVDLSARQGQVVRAPQTGVVTFAGTVVDRGVVTVTHPDGLRSSLEPVRWSVRPGQRVLRGQAVGSVAAGPGHCAPGVCLHWGLRRGETYLDPMRWVLDRGPVVLLPVG